MAAMIQEARLFVGANFLSKWTCHVHEKLAHQNGCCLFLALYMDTVPLSEVDIGGATPPDNSTWLVVVE